MSHHGELEATEDGKRGSGLHGAQRCGQTHREVHSAFLGRSCSAPHAEEHQGAFSIKLRAKATASPSWVPRPPPCFPAEF